MRRMPWSEMVQVSWTRYEDDLIRTRVSRIGPRWSSIAAELPGRTEHAVRNRWHRLQDRQLDQQRGACDSVTVEEAAINNLA